MCVSVLVSQFETYFLNSKVEVQSKAVSPAMLLADIFAPKARSSWTHCMWFPLAASCKAVVSASELYCNNTHIMKKH